MTQLDLDPGSRTRLYRRSCCIYFLGRLSHPADLLLFPFCRFMEPDPMFWFPTWSTGRLLVLSWGVFIFLLANSYLGNLRAKLIIKEYEPPVHTHLDVVERNKAVYMAFVFFLLRHDKAPLFGIQLPEDLVKISKMAYKKNSFYSAVRSSF